jgi:sugar lactone lactonase YvrE
MFKKLPLPKVSSFAFFALCAALAGCAGPEIKPRADIPFPSPPDPARFYYERTITGSADVQVLDSESRMRLLLTGERRSTLPFSKPYDVAACQGNVFVTDSVTRFVFGFDFPGHRFFEVGTTGPGQLHKPLGINKDAQCNIYVVDAGQKYVFVYNKRGDFLYRLGGPEWFSKPTHVAVSPDGARVFVVDTGGVSTDEHRIRVFANRSGEHLHDIGTRGREEGKLNLPRDVEVAQDGLVYVVDGGNFRVQVFQQDGTFVRTFGKVGLQLGNFARPKGIALDPEGRVYVGDAAFGNFQIFEPSGQLLMFIGNRSEKPAPAKFMLPNGIDVDEDGRVYFVDQFFAKVEVFRPAELAKDQGALAAGLATDK